MGIKAYKVFHSDWSCSPNGNRKEYIGPGTEHTDDRPLKICESGIHACLKLNDCFSYYRFNASNKVAEVELIGDVVTHKNDSKIATNHIRIIRELSWNEVLDLVNTGSGNTGICNTGNHNTGYHNTGNHNTGYHNTGDHNTGYQNTGHCNTGYQNTGHWNTGNSNAGDLNVGNFNSGNRNTGMFNTDEPFMRCFNKLTSIKYSDYIKVNGCAPIQPIIISKKMEPIPYKDAWKTAWKEATPNGRKWFTDLPNFDPKIFKQITGITVRIKNDTR
jgi:hypothetical protein